MHQNDSKILYCFSFGNLKDGVMDIKMHPWFRSVDWQAIHNRKALPPIMPKVKSPHDTSNFDRYDTHLSIHVAEADKYAEEFADF